MKRPTIFVRKSSWVILIASFLFLNSSCVTTDTTLKRDYIKKSEAQQQIETLKKRQEVELTAATSAISKQKDTIIIGQDDQLQTVANSLYGANLAFSFYTPPEPSRVDLIVNNRVTEAAAATGKKATAEAMERENSRLQKELNEKITSLEDLKKKHEDTVTENTILANKTATDKKELDRLGKELSDMKIQHAKELSDEQAKVIILQDEINKLEKARADDSVARQKLEREVKIKAIAVCGILSLLCIAGAIWMPAFKSKFAVAAATFGGCAAAILYVQPWMVAAGVGVVILGIIIKMSLEHHTMDKVATNAIGYIADNKPTDTTTLKNYMGQYTTDSDGKTTVTTDPAVEKVIDQKLKDGQRI